ncbi:MAG: hypothetical protein KGI38_01560 [Thaumarchaeota archaeon]|nr:hypothetical protein [Nitrososphaerota archaeon]
MSALPHDCMEKAREIRRRTSVMLGLDAHDVVSELCREWGTSNADEFYAHMKGLSDDELRAYVQEAWKRIKRKKLAMKVEEVSAYG